MFLYNVYGKRMAINIELPLLQKSNDDNDYELKVCVDFGDINGETIIIEEQDGRFAVLLGSLAHYTIDSINNEIYCKTPNSESFFSTFFNIPFSVYCMCKDELLFHACSLLHNNEIFCLTGNKGIGKSTLTSILNLNNNFRIFSDDTVHISNGLAANRAHNLIKQTTETVNALGISTLNVQNVAGKYYSSFDSLKTTAIIGKIFQLVRTNELKFTIRPIRNEIKKDSIYRTNIVGISYMPYSLINKALKVKPNIKIRFYELIIPNDLNFLIQNKNDLIEKILSINEWSDSL